MNILFHLILNVKLSLSIFLGSKKVKIRFLKIIIDEKDNCYILIFDI
jgi:hypothetical protein